MQPSPVEILPVEPAPRTARREPAGRGFADLLAGDGPTAKPDSPRADGPRADGPDTGRQKPPGETATRPRAALDETRPRAALDATDDAAHTGPQTADHRAAVPGARGPADAAPETGDPVAAPAETVLPESAAAAPQAPVIAAPGALQIPQGVDAASAPAAQAAPDSEAAAAPSASPAPPAAVPPAADTPATASAAGQDAGPDAATAGRAAVSGAPAVTGAAPDSPPQAAGEHVPMPARPEAAAATPPAASGTLDAAATAVATAAPRQAGVVRDTGTAAVPAAPASPAAPAAAAAAGTDSANGLTQGDADAAFGPPESTPGQNKPQDMTGRTTVPAQPAAAGQAIEQPGGGPRAGMPEAPITGSEPGPRLDAPPTGQAAAHGQAASPPGAFANELRLTANAPAASDAAAGRTAPGPVVDQMAVQISRAVSDGQDKLTIDLRPAVLGRVSVSLEVGHDHRVIAVISADRADTLELLQRDARTLERALQDAGLKTDSGSLSFSLNGDGAKKSPFSDGGDPEQLVAAQPSDDEADAPPAAHNPYARVLNPAGIDIHV